MSLPVSPQHDSPRQDFVLPALQFLLHLLDGLDILLERRAGPGDVGLSRHVEPPQPLDLGGEGGGWGGHGVIQDVVLLLHYPGQVLGHLRAGLNKVNYFRLRLSDELYLRAQRKLKEM